MRAELTCKCPKCGATTSMSMADLAVLWTDLRDDDWHIEREPEGEDFRIYLVKGEGVSVSAALCDEVH